MSFCKPMKSFRSGGITRRTACGRTTEASAWPRVSPSERAAASWLEAYREALEANYVRLDALLEILKSTN